MQKSTYQQFVQKARERAQKRFQKTQDAKFSSHYHFTLHAQVKMRHYGISESRVKRVLRRSDRVEESIVPDMAAYMQKAGTSKHSYEIWVMVAKPSARSKSSQAKVRALAQRTHTTGQVKIISVWRYPGESPKRDPIPGEILEEIRSFIGS